MVVPFGGSTAEGFVLSVRAAAADEDLLGLKLISDAPDDEAWFDDEMLATARWLSDYYVCSLGEALRLFIPGKSGIKKTRIYQIAASGEKPEQKTINKKN